MTVNASPYRDPPEPAKRCCCGPSPISIRTRDRCFSGKKTETRSRRPNGDPPEITGVGYRAQAQGKKLKLQLGYSHDVDLDVPEGLEVKTPDQTTVEISGIDKQAVGQFAAEVRAVRKPEPYKGKGIRYEGETVHRKAGKTAQ